MRKRGRLKYFVASYLVGIVFFTLFRLCNTLVYGFSLPQWPDFHGLWWQAMGIGWRFDTLVSCYLLALPLVLLGVADLFRRPCRTYCRVVHVLMVAGYMVCFLACAIDIPFFNYFFTRLNAVAANEVDSFGLIVGMIFTNPAYIAGIVAYLAAMVGYGSIMRRLFRLMDDSRLFPYTLLLVALVFVGMRGGLGKRPLRVNAANYCADPFLNQLGLNPAFTLMKSAGELSKSAKQPLQLVDDASAQQQYDAEHSTPADSSLMPPGLSLPLPDGTNVVLVIMESMTAEKTALGTLPSLTPCLDSLMAQSLTFTRVYSAGIHTYNGIFSTLYSTPGVPSRHTFIPRMNGLPWMLHHAGYQTAYCMTHDEDYDGMRPFLYGNGFDSVIGQHSYPADEVVGTWGVPDHVLFDHVLEYCGRASRRGPFFATVMTCSDHVPYYLPKGIDFHPHSSGLEDQMAEYADWSIGRFMRMARKQAWFANTLFVFIADHGGLRGENHYDMALSYQHVPMLFYCPAHIAPQFDERLALQIDLGPTLLGMLPITSADSTFGLNLLVQRREVAYFSSDDKIGALDGDYFYVYHLYDDLSCLYDLATGQPADDHERAQRLRDHALALTQQSYNLYFKHQ